MKSRERGGGLEILRARFLGPGGGLAARQIGQGVPRFCLLDRRLDPNLSARALFHWGLFVSVT